MRDGAWTRPACALNRQAQASKSQSYSQGLATLCTMINDAARVESREAVLLYTALTSLQSTSGGEGDLPSLPVLQAVCDDMLRNVEAAAGLHHHACTLQVSYRPRAADCYCCCCCCCCRGGQV